MSLLNEFLKKKELAQKQKRVLETLFHVADSTPAYPVEVRLDMNSDSYPMIQIDVDPWNLSLIFEHYADIDHRLSQMRVQHPDVDYVEADARKFEEEYFRDLLWDLVKKTQFCVNDSHWEGDQLIVDVYQENSDAAAKDLEIVLARIRAGFRGSK